MWMIANCTTIKESQLPNYRGYHPLVEPSIKEWNSSPRFNTWQIQTAVDIARGDDGFEGKKVIEILLQIKGETS